MGVCFCFLFVFVCFPYYIFSYYISYYFCFAYCFFCVFLYFLKVFISFGHKLVKWDDFTYSNREYMHLTTYLLICRTRKSFNSYQKSASSEYNSEGKTHFFTNLFIRINNVKNV